MLGRNSKQYASSIYIGQTVLNSPVQQYAVTRHKIHNQVAVLQKQNICVLNLQACVHELQFALHAQQNSHETWSLLAVTPRSLRLSTSVSMLSPSTKLACGFVLWLPTYSTLHFYMKI